MKSDDEILEAGGTQEDINNYAHDVGGACGAAYGGTCDHPTCEFNENKSETMTNQASEQPILLIGTVRSVDMYRRANLLNPNNSKRISKIEDARGYRETGEVLAVGDWYRFNDILNLSRELEQYGFTIRSVQA